MVEAFEVDEAFFDEVGQTVMVAGAVTVTVETKSLKVLQLGQFDTWVELNQYSTYAVLETVIV